MDEHLIKPFYLKNIPLKERQISHIQSLFGSESWTHDSVI